MKRVQLLVAFLVPFVIAGCGQPQVIVEAAITDPATGERLALGDLPIRLLPYDRDAIFDSLEQAYPEPEPTVPPEILEAQQQIQVAQTEWQAAQERWGTIRDSMRTLLDQLRQMEGQGLRGTPQYNQGFQRFNALEQQERAANQASQQSFTRFTQLQEASLASADSIRALQDLWAEEAFADFNLVVSQKLRELGREELADTTNAEGFAALRAPSGRWWVYARYTLPYEELYWNLPIEVSSDSTYVGLNRENAEARPIF